MYVCMCTRVCLFKIKVEKKSGLIVKCPLDFDHSQEEAPCSKDPMVVAPLNLICGLQFNTNELYNIKNIAKAIIQRK